jgi:hypothetical protein
LKVANASGWWSKRLTPPSGGSMRIVGSLAIR